MNWSGAGGLAPAHLPPAAFAQDHHHGQPPLTADHRKSDHLFICAAILLYQRLPPLPSHYAPRRNTHKKYRFVLLNAANYRHFSFPSPRNGFLSWLVDLFQFNPVESKI